MTNIETPTYYMATKKYELFFPPLETDLDTDVVVIGGDFSGINTALELAEHGITGIAVLEARHLGLGGTGRNGGRIVADIGHDLEKIRRDVGEDGLRTIFEISDLGADIVGGRIEKHTIDADFCHGYDYMGFNARQVKTLQAWKKEFRSLGSPHEIRYLYDAEVRQIIGSGAYGSTLLRMGDDHVHSLNLLLGEIKALAGLGARIFEYSPALEVQCGEHIRMRTAKGSAIANKLSWACDSFLNRLEPELHRTTINTHAFQMMTESLPGELIQRISPVRDAYSDIRPVIDYYRMTNENRLLLGATTPFVECIPGDLKAWNRKLMLKIFPYLEYVHIDLAWGGPMTYSANLFPQIGSLSGRPNTFFVQGYSGFGMTSSHTVCKAPTEGTSEGSTCYDLLSSVCRIPIHGKDYFRPLLLSAGKIWHQFPGYWNGWR